MSMPSVLVILYAASLVHQTCQAQAQELLPVMPKVDPIADGIFIRSANLPTDGMNIDRERERLIMYDFRPAMPPYTAESSESYLNDLLLIPKKKKVEQHLEPEVEQDQEEDGDGDEEEMNIQEGREGEVDQARGEVADTDRQEQDIMDVSVDDGQGLIKQKQNETFNTDADAENAAVDADADVGIYPSEEVVEPVSVSGSDHGDGDGKDTGSESNEEPSSLKDETTLEQEEEQESATTIDSDETTIIEDDDDDDVSSTTVGDESAGKDAPTDEVVDLPEEQLAEEDNSEAVAQEYKNEVQDVVVESAKDLTGDIGESQSTEIESEASVEPIIEATADADEALEDNERSEQQQQHETADAQDSGRGESIEDGVQTDADTEIVIDSSQSSSSSQDEEYESPAEEEAALTISQDDHVSSNNNDQYAAATETEVELKGETGAVDDNSNAMEDNVEVESSPTTKEQGEWKVVSAETETIMATEFDLEDILEEEKEEEGEILAEENTIVEEERSTSEAEEEMDISTGDHQKEGVVVPEAAESSEESQQLVNDALPDYSKANAGVVRPEAKVQIQYDDDATILSTKTSSLSTNSNSNNVNNNNNNNREANRQFVTGLDEIDKLFESVEVPDELDVGADGSSMQDVLVGQGLKIIWKRAKSLGSGVKDKFENLAGDVKGALKPLGNLLGNHDDEEEEEDDMNISLDSLLNLNKLRDIDGSGESKSKSTLSDDTIENKKKDELVKEARQIKSDDAGDDEQSKSKQAKQKQKEGDKEKEKGGEEKESKKKKKKRDFPILNIKSPKAQKIWKFARRKWEQAKHILDDLFGIFDEESDDPDDNFGLGDMKLGEGMMKGGPGAGLKQGQMPNFDGKFGSEVDESFLKSRYESMMKDDGGQKKKG